MFPRSFSRPLAALRVSLQPAEVEQHAAVVLDPRIVAGRHVERVAGPYLQLGSIGHPDCHPSLEDVADVLDLAHVGAAERLHMLGPAPTRLERSAPDHVPVQIDELHLALAVFELTDFVRGAKALSLDLCHCSSLLKAFVCDTLEA